jgi:hypothetical protein
MGLEGQHEDRTDRGYAMATLLVALAVMSVLMSAALPAWRHQARREKEAELIFRGEQYARAIGLWERKMGPGSRPPTLDMLVQQRFLRKKYKDPMVEDGEFQPVFMGMNPSMPGPGGRSGRGGAQPPQQPLPPQAPQQGVAAGIQGVVSKSKDTSIRVYKGRTHYNEWLFVHAGATNAPGGRGAPMPGMGPGGRGPGRGPGPDGRGPGGRGPGGRGIGPGGRGAGPGGGFPGRGRGQ